MSTAHIPESDFCCPRHGPYISTTGWADCPGCREEEREFLAPPDPKPTDKVEISRAAIESALDRMGVAGYERTLAFTDMMEEMEQALGKEVYGDEDPPSEW